MKATQYKTLRRVRANRYHAEGSFSEYEWECLLDVYGHKCLCCGRVSKFLHRDHIVPLSQGGTDFISNIQPLCHSCNSSKGTKQTDYRPFPLPEMPLASERKAVQSALDKAHEEYAQAHQAWRTAKNRADEWLSQIVSLGAVLEHLQLEAKERLREDKVS